MKKLAQAALIYALIALSSGVFYREFTKIMDFQGQTKLSIIHGHYFTLGVFFCLLLLILEKQFKVLQQPKATLWLKMYHVGLNITGGAFLVRGITEVLAIEMSKGMSASISGVAGIGHGLLGIGLFMILLKLKKAVK